MKAGKLFAKALQSWGCHSCPFLSKCCSSDSSEDCVLTLSCTEKGSHPLPVTTEFQPVFQQNTVLNPGQLSPKQPQGFSKKCNCESSFSVPPEPAHEGDLRKLTSLSTDHAILVNTGLIN